MKNLPNNSVINLSVWNAATASTRFPQYQSSWRTGYANGGIVDPYKIAGNSFILGNIEDNNTRFSGDRDTRSNFMSRSYTNPSGWINATNYTSRMNFYTISGNRNGRLSYDTATGIITTLNTSIYLLYADLIISNVTSTSFCELYIQQGSTPVAGGYEALPTNGCSAYLQVNFLSLYQASNYSVAFRLGGNATMQLKFGYAEFIGNKNRCGEILI